MSKPIGLMTAEDIDDSNRTWLGISDVVVGWQDDTSTAFGTRRGDLVILGVALKLPNQEFSESNDAVQRKFCKLPTIKLD